MLWRKQSDVDLHVIFLAETDPTLRQWHVYKEEIRVLVSGASLVARRVRQIQRSVEHVVFAVLWLQWPDMILCGGYNYVASWQALGLGDDVTKPHFFSGPRATRQDRRRGHAMVEFLKNEFLRKCSGFVVPGRSAREYLRALKKIKGSHFYCAECGRQ